MSESAPQMTPASATAGDEALLAVRAEMDRVDAALLELVAQRLKLAGALAGPEIQSGVSLPIRPAREVGLLRRLVNDAPAGVDPELIMEVWRALIGAHVRTQALVDVVIGGGGNDGVRLFDIARRHFGARTRIQRAPEPQTALMRALEKPNTVAVVPWPAAPGVGSWWPALSESRFSKLQLVAGLPMRGPASEDPEACIFAVAPTEPAGDDITLMIAQDPHHRAQRALSEQGLRGRELARSEPRALIRIEGFVALDDPRVHAMSRYGLDGVRVLGSYARV